MSPAGAVHVVKPLQQLGFGLQAVCFVQAGLSGQADGFDFFRGGRCTDRVAHGAVGFLSAHYAQPVVRFLSQSFAKVKLLVFAKKLFPDLSEDTVLLLAEGRGSAFKELTLHQLHDADALSQATSVTLDRDSGQSTTGWTNGVTRLVEYLLPASTRGKRLGVAS